MTEQPDPERQARADDALVEPTAGALLRAAREAQGLHIAALATAIKVTPRKLEALEGNRLQELPDATFARALAQTVCRHLKIDPKPVLALLPAHGSVSLEPPTRIQGAPYRQQGGRPEPGRSARDLGPWIWGAALLVIAAAAVVLVPGGWWQPASPRPAADANPATAVTPAAPLAPAAAVPASAAETTATAASAAVQAATPATPAASAATGVAPAPTTVEPSRERQSATETVFSAPPGDASAAPSVGGVLVITTTDASWIEVRDARGRTLLSETVQPGRTVGLDGAPPLRLLVGNASATKLVFKGRPVDIGTRSRENVARFELQ